MFSAQRVQKLKEDVQMLMEERSTCVKATRTGSITTCYLCLSFRLCGVQANLFASLLCTNTFIP